jgi:hypothetical protein
MKKYMQEYRQKQKQLTTGESKSNCKTNSKANVSQADKDIEEERELDKEKDIKNNKVVRHKYGEYKNVLLSDEDYSKLINEFPYDYMERIERLSEYMASTGKSYKNHLATIRNWAKKDVKTDKPKTEYNRFMDELKDIYFEGDM